MKRIAHLMVALAAAVWIVHDLGSPAKKTNEPSISQLADRLSRAGQAREADESSSVSHRSTDARRLYHPVSSPAVAENIESVEPFSREAIVEAKIESWG